MVKIKVIFGGCGIEYIDNHGNTRHALKTPEDGPFDCQEDVAERLVSLGRVCSQGEYFRTFRG